MNLTSTSSAWDRLTTLARFVTLCVGLCLWTLLGFWTASAIFFTAPLPGWLAIVLAVASAALFAYGWRKPRLMLASAGVTAVIAVWFFLIIQPDPNQVWSPEQARMPVVKIEGDKVHVANVRNFTWKTRTDFVEGFYDRVYDVSAISSVYYLVVPLGQVDAAAHVFLCFGFSDGQHVAISVEGRRMKDQPFRVVSSMFHQYQLIYIIGDERDVVGMRGAVWKQPVRFYPAKSTPERKRALFLDMMRRAHSLEERPEFYNLIWNNCMNNITYHLRTLGYRPVPSDLSVVLTGTSDRVAFDHGFFDTDLPFEKARVAFRIDEWMQTAPLDEHFSVRLRENLARQVAEISAKVNE